MTKKMLAPIAAICWLAMTPAAADCPLADPADCVYVDDDCVTNPGTGTELDPFCTIQGAYDSVVGTTTPADPATILVRAGTYNECVDAATTFDFDPTFNEDRPVHLIADEWLIAGSPHPDPADASSFEAVAQMTTISGLGVCDGATPPRAPALTLAGTGASVEGFAITAGGASGVVGLGAVTISDNLVFMNEGELGGGIQLTTQTCAYGDVTSLITFNVVRDNLALDFDELGAGDGGGIFVGADGSEVDFDCLGGISDVTVCDNLVHGNTAQNNVIVGVNDTFAGGGGISVETLTVVVFDLPENVRAQVLICRNRIFDNMAAPGEDGFGFGGGIFASTLGNSVESIEIENNEVGPNNQGVGPESATTFGGGISVSAAPSNSLGLHDIAVHDNSVFQNQADVGGGMDLLAVADSLFQLQSLSVAALNNTIEDNESLAEAGGMNVEFNSARSLDLADKAEYFPGADAFWVADEIDVTVSGNVVRNNTSGTAGAGAVLRPSADADPIGVDERPAVAIIDFEANYLEGNVAQATAGVGGRPGCSDPVCEAVICAAPPAGDPFCCDTEWDQLCANAAALDPNCDCDTSDCCISSVQEVIGAGVLAIPAAKGEALAGVTMMNSTLVDNAMTADAFVGGVEVAALTLPDTDDTFTGMTELNIDRCIVAYNDADGIGGPPFDPGVTDLSVNVTNTSSYGNGDSNPNNDPDLNYEDTLFPSGPPPGNIMDDPLLDPVSFVPDLCSPVYDVVGHCEAEPTTACTDDADCTVPATDVCVAKGAGYLASPDINFDDALDGVDLMRLSATFGADGDVDARYNSDADIDRNGMVDGADLPFIAPLFGQECTP